MKYLSFPAVILLIVLAFLSQRSETADSFDQQQEQQDQETELQESDSSDSSSVGGDGPDRFRTGDRVRYTEEGGTGRFDDLEPSSVSIATDEGNVVINATGDDRPEDGYTWDISDPMAPSLQGFKIVDDHFEPLHGPPTSVDEYAVTWDENGDVVLTNSESSVTLSRSDDEVSVEVENEDGAAETRTNGGEGPLDIDGRIQAEGEDVGPIFGTDPSEPFAPLGLESETWAWIGLGVAMTMLVTGAFLVFKDGLGLIVVDVADRELDLTGTQTKRAAVADQRVLNLFDELRRDPDADRVIRYLYELVGMGKWGIPEILAHETPYEFLTRCSANLDMESGQLLRGLTEQYTAVRFAPELITISDRDKAIDYAEELYGRLHGVGRTLAGV